jgi:hypothetical protein
MDREILARVDFEQAAQALSTPESRDTARRLLEKMRTPGPTPVRVAATRKKTRPPEPPAVGVDGTEQDNIVPLRTKRMATL